MENFVLDNVRKTKDKYQIPGSKVSFVITIKSQFTDVFLFVVQGSQGLPGPRGPPGPAGAKVKETVGCNHEMRS